MVRNLSGSLYYINFVFFCLVCCLFSCYYYIFRYSFAIVGINMTELVYTLLLKGKLKTHFYNYKQSRPTLEEFHEIYCKYSYIDVCGVGGGVINLTELVYTLLSKGKLKTYFYNYKQSRPTLEEFHEIYCRYSYIDVCGVGGGGGINLTELVYTLLSKGKLKTYFYNYKQSRPT